MPTSRTMIRWVLSELFGTAILAMTVAVIITQSSSSEPNAAFVSLFMPFGIGLTLFVLVALFGKVASAHFNPAVTLGQMIFRKISGSQGVIYILSQILGAWIGVLLAHILLGGPTIAQPATPNSAVVLGEFAGTFLLSLACTLVHLKKVEPAAGSFVIGSSLALGVMLALAQGAGILNPALALAYGVTHWAYLIIPLLGGIGGAALAVIFDEESEPPRPHLKRA